MPSSQRPLREHPWVASVWVGPGIRGPSASLPCPPCRLHGSHPAPLMGDAPPPGRSGHPAGLAPPLPAGSRPAPMLAPLCRAAVPGAPEGTGRSSPLCAPPVPPEWNRGPATVHSPRPLCPLAPAMAPLLALFLVALAGLPLGKMEGGWREGRILAGAGSGEGGRTPLTSLLPLCSSALGRRWDWGSDGPEEGSSLSVTPPPARPQPRPWTATCAPTTGRTASTRCAARPWSPTA